ncbi:hypothetical protein X801_03682 [Opisthorchis viverrini]|uniref:Uncharacterized protein n=1 Tax=Opisthorchis viverrini TaxID=6198 RepID=A0A1S8X150_OPIVI|nr:hypothetical protein X801_03682 [Opisthorchis viverrini]
MDDRLSNVDLPDKQHKDMSLHVFRRRDVLRISPLFYKGLLDYIRAKRGGDLPDQPAATGEEPAKPKLKLRKRQKPQSAAVSPRSIPRPRPKKVKKEVGLFTVIQRVYGNAGQVNTGFVRGC